MVSVNNSGFIVFRSRSEDPSKLFDQKKFLGVLTGVVEGILTAVSKKPARQAARRLAASDARHSPVYCVPPYLLGLSLWSINLQVLVHLLENEMRSIDSLTDTILCSRIEGKVGLGNLA